MNGLNRVNDKMAAPEEEHTMDLGRKQFKMSLNEMSRDVSDNMKLV